MSIALWLIPVLVPCLLGMLGFRCLYGREYRKCFSAEEIFLNGFCVLIGLAEAAHLGAVVLNRSVTWMAAALWGLTAFLCFLSLALMIREGRKKDKKSRISVKQEDASKSTVQLLWGCLALSLVFQVIMIMTGGESYREGDMTIETVQTFLSDNAVYQTNPLTGRAYEGGIPLRLEILCLPSLYSSTAILTGEDVNALLAVFRVVVLLGSYLAFSSLAKVLFQNDKTGRIVMLILVSLLIWCGDYMISMDGFQLLHCGYRGTAVRNGILVPFTLSMCLQKKWKGAVVAILAETCIVWTLYGLGACLLITVVMVLFHLTAAHREGRRCRNS
ncbi:MAG: hypothetical protein IJ324_13410 [Lachnospiraceae bacterium]|nr:hypothetical protein [Lachnospiraceae bacterium]MBQ8232121.1 hypothetical protein [Lachnospiraceae bacterium]